MNNYFYAIHSNVLKNNSEIKIEEKEIKIEKKHVTQPNKSDKPTFSQSNDRMTSHKSGNAYEQQLTKHDGATNYF